MCASMHAVRRIVCLIAVTALVSVVWPSAAPAKGCGALAVASGPYGKVSVTVTSGKTSCRRARSAARRMFSGRGCYHYTGVTGSSYFEVGSWRGNGHMEEWYMRNVDTGARISGTYRMKPGGKVKDVDEC